MKEIDESEGLVTPITLETFLSTFENLSVDTAGRSDANKTDKKKSKPDKPNEMQRSECHFPRMPLRYLPYKVPRRFLLALQQQRLNNSQTASAAADSSIAYGNSLPNICLDGCDFGGRPLTSDPKEFTGEQQKKRTVNGRVNCSSSPASFSAAFSFFRGAPLRPRPCWLQHFHSSADCPPTAISEDGTTKYGGKEENKDIQSQQQQTTRDLGLAELTDYFQHFVCLCSPRMSDQAQSMYA